MTPGLGCLLTFHCFIYVVFFATHAHRSLSAMLAYAFVTWLFVYAKILSWEVLLSAYPGLFLKAKG